ncbi:MAG: PIN domain-containing protein [Bacteroidetes bacterium]|jgi:predicted nucleic acid-binding protein|nr:PIN domain-containing protein [Bacteroidota bacterium]
MIVDTNVIIDFLKGNKAAVEFIDGLPVVRTSVVVVSELFSGVQEKNEMDELEEFLKYIESINVSVKIAKRAGLLRRKFLKSHGIEITDAIIAATANDLNVPVATLDKKHFSVLTNSLITPY